MRVLRSGFDISSNVCFSDHVPLALLTNDVNWVPQPLRMQECWADFPGYAQYVRDKWWFRVETKAEIY
jgi:hypothetical protein